MVLLLKILPESYTKYRSEAQKALCLKRSWSDFDSQAYYLYGEDQNHETSFKGKALQAVVDSWCKIQVLSLLILDFTNLKYDNSLLNIIDQHCYGASRHVGAPARQADRESTCPGTRTDDH